MDSKKIFNFDKYIFDYYNEDQVEMLKMFVERYKDNVPESQLISLTRLFSNIEFLGCKYPEKLMQIVAELSKEVTHQYREKKLKRKCQQVSVDKKDGIEDPPLSNETPQKIKKTEDCSCCTHAHILTDNQRRGLDFRTFIIYEGCNSSGQLESCPIKILEDSALREQWPISWTFPPDKNNSENTEKHCEVTLNDKFLSSGSGKTDKEARVNAAVNGLNFLSKICYTIQVKSTSSSNNTVSNDNSEPEEIKHPDPSSSRDKGGASEPLTIDLTQDEDSIEIQQLKEEFSFSSDEYNEEILSDEETNKCTVCHKLQLITGEESDEDIYDLIWDTLPENLDLSTNIVEDDDNDEVCDVVNTCEEKPHKRYRPARFRLYLPDGSFKRIRKDIIVTSQRLVEICQGDCVITYEDLKSDVVIRSLFSEFVQSSKYIEFLKSENCTVKDQLHSSSAVTDTNVTNKVNSTNQLTSEENTVNQHTDEVTTLNQPTGEVTTLNQPTNDVTTVNQPTGEVTSLNQPADEVTTLNQPTDEVTTLNQPTDEVTTLKQSTGEVTTLNQPTDEVTNLKQPTGEVTTLNQPTDEVNPLNKPTDEVTSLEQPTDEVTTLNQPTGEVTTLNQPTDKITTINQPACKDQSKEYFTWRQTKRYRSPRLTFSLPDGSWKRINKNRLYASNCPKLIKFYEQKGTSLVPVTYEDLRTDEQLGKEIFELFSYENSEDLQILDDSDGPNGTQMGEITNVNLQCTKNTESNNITVSDERNNDTQENEASSLLIHPEENETLQHCISVDEKIKIFLPDGSYKRVPLEHIKNNKELLEFTKYSPGQSIKSCKVTLSDLKTNEALRDLFSDFLSLYNLK